MKKKHYEDFLNEFRYLKNASLIISGDFYEPRLNQEIEKLPKMEKSALELFFRKGTSQKDIARDLKLSRSKVNRLISKAITKLKERLK